MTIQITVYGRKNCQPCYATRRRLDALKVPYIYRDVDDEEIAKEARIIAAGRTELPVVAVTGGVVWTGYRHDELGRLAELRVTAPDLESLEPAAVVEMAEDDPFPLSVRFKDDDEEPPVYRARRDNDGLYSIEGVTRWRYHAEELVFLGGLAEDGAA